ncbi:MAG: hypothetical protein ACREEP_19920, partial [Dongiaceae bacterium]
MAALLLPSWLLPEGLWVPLWRATARIPVLTSQRAIKRLAGSIGTALGEPDKRRCEAIARNLRAAIDELRMQDLR